MLKQVIISSLVLASFAAVPAAQAQVSDLPSVKVSFSGIDTRTESGARIMLQRIKMAAGQVCGGEPSQTLDRVQKFAPCVHEVTQRTVSDLNNTRLTALFNKEPAPATLASAH